MQVTDTTKLQNWTIKCKDKNNNGRMQNFIKSAKRKSPAGKSGAASSPPVDDNLFN